MVCTRYKIYFSTPEPEKKLTSVLFKEITDVLLLNDRKLSNHVKISIEFNPSGMFFFLMTRSSNNFLKVTRKFNFYM